MLVRHGNGAGFTFPVPIPDSHILTGYPTHTQRGWEREPHPHPRWVWVSPPHPRPRIQYFFLIKIEVFLQPLEKCCNTLSSNMLTLTFVRPIDLVAHLNINDSFYNTTIIKQITSHINIKVIFLHLGRVWVWVRDGYLYTRYLCFEIGENPNPYPNPVKTGKTRQIGFGSGG